MEISLKQAFSLLDGRLSTSMQDVHEMLDYIFSDELFTHQLPSAMKKIKEVNPPWFAAGVSVLDAIKEANNTDDFEALMKIIDKGFLNYTIKLGKIEYLFPIDAGLENFQKIKP